jgi:hypothetical protein
MAPNVLTVTRDELLARREELLAQAGLTLEELRSRAETYSLSGEEWELVTELDHIDFLLG